MLWTNYALASHQELRQSSRLHRFLHEESPTLNLIRLPWFLSPSQAAIRRHKTPQNRLFLFHSLSILKLKHRSISSTSQKRPAHDAKRLQCAWATKQWRGVLWLIFNMADTKIYENVTPSCDHKALKECLDRNNGDRSKCMKEWEDFQRSCAENKR